MEKTKHSRLVPGLFAVFAFAGLLFGLVMNSWLGMLFKPPKWPQVLNFLPSILLIGTAFIVNKIERGRLAIIITSCVVSLVLFAGLLFLNGAICFGSSVRPETDPSNYQDVLAVLGYPETGWLQHFPAGIPENAKDESLYWAKGFLQSGTILQLRYVLPKGEIEALLAESLGKAKQVQETGGNYISPVGPNDLVIPSLRAGETGDVNWPKGYKIMTFDGKSGNHGFGYGVAISIKRNEVVYWAEYW